jgi:hypothetical protein
MAGHHGVAAPVVPLGFLEGAAPCAGGYVIHGINEALQPGAQKTPCLVIGGGDILRTDAAHLGQHYCSISRKDAPRNFWSRLKEKWAGQKPPGQEFAERFMGYSPIAPFIVDKAGHSNVGAVAYVSCGVPFGLPPEKSAAIRAAFESADFIYLRDASSRDKLKTIGVARDIEVAPDLIVTLSDFFDKDQERAKGLGLLAQYGVAPSKEIICFQSIPQRKSRAEEMLRQLLALKKKTGAQIVLLPIGYCHGDDVFLKQLAEKSGGALIYAGIHSIYGIISVIAASRLFIGTSLHGNITAFSFGIPHLFGPIAIDKVAGFLEVAGLDADFKLTSWSDLENKHAMIGRLPPDFFALKAEAAKQKVHGTFSKLAKILEDSNH